MDNDKLIKADEYGMLVEREVDGKIKNIFIISQEAFDKAYNAHQNWYKKFKDRLYDETMRPICDLYDFTKLEYIDVTDRLDEDCRRYEHRNYYDSADFCECMYSYENINISKPGYLSFADLRNAYLEDTLLKRVDLKLFHLERVDLRNAHLEGAHLENANLAGAHLNPVHLESAYLEGANLKHARLDGAYLDGADLKHARLEDAHLDFAHLKGAHLSAAHLEGAHLSNAVLYSNDFKVNDSKDKNVYKHLFVNLQGAKLYNVDLSHIKGLTAEQIAGADLTGAKLPQNLDNLTEVIQPVNDAIKSNGTLFTAILIISLLVFLICLSFKAGDSSIEFSVLGNSVGIEKVNFWVIPVILLFIHWGFQTNMCSFWKILGCLPAIFPDGRHLPDVINPWFPTSYIYAFFKVLICGKFIYDCIEKYIVIKIDTIKKYVKGDLIGNVSVIEKYIADVYKDETFEKKIWSFIGLCILFILTYILTPTLIYMYILTLIYTLNPIKCIKAYKKLEQKYPKQYDNINILFKILYSLVIIYGMMPALIIFVCFKLGFFVGNLWGIIFAAFIIAFSIGISIFYYIFMKKYMKK